MAKVSRSKKPKQSPTQPGFRLRLKCGGHVDASGSYKVGDVFQCAKDKSILEPEKYERVMDDAYLSTPTKLGSVPEEVVVVEEEGNDSDPDTGDDGVEE